MTIGEMIGLLLIIAMIVFLWVCLKIGSDDK